jgi:hypothetical protein
MSFVSSDSNKNLFFSTLSAVEKVLYNTERKFYLDNGYSVVDAEENAWRKIQNTRKLVKSKSILKY